MKSDKVENNTIIEVNSDTNTNSKDNVTVSDDKITVNKIEKKNNKSKKIIIILIIAILVIAFLFGALYFLGVFKKPVSNNNNTVPPVIIESDNFTYKDGILYIHDANNEELGSYECVNKNIDKCYLAQLNNEDDVFDNGKYVDQSGNPIIRYTKVYSNRYAFIYDESQVKLYDLKEKQVINTYKFVKTGNVGTNLVVYNSLEGNYGIISITDTVTDVLKGEYDYLGINDSETTFIARKNYKSYLVDTKGKELTPHVNGNIKRFNDKYLVVDDNKSYSLYDYAGNGMLSESYDYITFDENYIFAIDNSKMFIYDKDLNKINYTAIKLKSTNYVKTFVFDSSNNIIETKQAFGVSYEEGYINIDVTDGFVVKVNLFENKLNNNYNFIIYSDGYLYFYSDEKKTDLIGSYKCNTKNEVTSTSTEFNTCFIAKTTNIVNSSETLGYIPIINSTYVFIKDGGILYLYDLKTNKSISNKYVAVDTTIGKENIEYVTSLSDRFIIKNSDGYYGIISFSSDGPVEILKAVDKSGSITEYTRNIKRFNDSLLLVYRTSNNCLVDNDGNNVECSKYNIIDYVNGYLIVNDSSKFIIYKGGTIIATGFSYVKIYDTFFLGVKDNKLNVYDLTPNSIGKIATPIDVEGNEYDDRIILETSSSEYIITIKGDGDTAQTYKYNSSWELISPQENNQGDNNEN